MLVERTDVTVRSGTEDAFDAAMSGRGRALLGAVAGVLWVRFGRGVEHPDTFMLLVGWDSMATHHAYHATEACAEVRALMQGYATGATMQHFELA